MEHKPIPKRIREIVYQKYDGHCAYCGCELQYKDMQVDHIVSVFRSTVQDDSIENLMPSCRRCNFYKAGDDINGFRRKIREWLERSCRESFQVKLAMKYGILTYKPWDGKFYFEKGGE